MDTENFNSFLRLLSLGTDEYALLPLGDRLSILREFKASQPELEKPLAQPQPQAGTSTTESSLNGEMKTSTSSNLPGHYETHAILSRHEDYLQLKESLYFRPFTRMRVKIPIREVNANFIDDLSGKQILWLTRVFFHCETTLRSLTDKAQPEVESDTDSLGPSQLELDEKEEMEATVETNLVCSPTIDLEFLFKEIFSHKTLTTFVTYLQKVPKSESLTAVTLRSGLYVLSSIVYQLGGGKNLSRFTDQMLTLARESLRQIEDVTAKFNASCTIQKNQAESDRIRQASLELPAMEFIRQIYYFCKLHLLSPSSLLLYPSLRSTNLCDVCIFRGSRTTFLLCSYEG